MIINGRGLGGESLSGRDMCQSWSEKMRGIDPSTGITLGNLRQDRVAGNEILSKYCSSCIKSGECIMSANVKEALGENSPLWYESHIPVWAEGLPSGEGHVFCCEYESSQPNLPGMEESDGTDGVERLLEVVGITL